MWNPTPDRGLREEEEEEEDGGAAPGPSSFPGGMRGEAPPTLRGLGGPWVTLGTRRVSV